ncbi:hypothetical protein NK553_04115 [Pseudomonas sp. ZM23]|uniref:Uncharacterized protein n=1 Tax=Pseudomonas triclosanedens TaxID=2961893 RepID=A0ABY6ZV49_9PSED|nr:hypothetical protein [Pseudomonas triclosanedens]MCP8463126.1 hypothetical protein [Pseudomonas triclosanedens]MCP8469815.1 hypothetical protein [Pseudomonas triclosanedens]MCP8473927.1 hypothetical protein [Pseudomonas triclosanedens]WAI48674.1 hypothetical protein OU419_23385 [Pseudomonas triclosanedens]
MEIIFFWEGDGGSREPNCRSDVLSDEGVDLLACVLTDHGGQGYGSTIGWLDEGLSRVELVKRGAVESSDWSRECWGVGLSGETARIYSLYDEDYFSNMSIDDFEKALLGWKRFILAG